MGKVDLVELVPRLRGHGVAVVGDLFLDEYIFGRATRLSREAPVPVLEVERRYSVPGGAANPAHNIAALGGQAYAVGVVGDDPAGGALRDLLREAGVDTRAVLSDPSRPTTTKTRIMASGSLRFPQQLARLDRLDRTPVNGSVTAALLTTLEALLPSCQAILVSDYKTGVMTPTMIRSCRELAHQRGLILTVDAQGDLAAYQGYDVVKCNLAEAEASVGFPLGGEQEIERAGALLLAMTGAHGLVITRGPQGMSVFGRDGETHHVPATNVTEVYDVTGAGDTVIAVLTLALTAGATLLQAAYLANAAAGVVVRRLGNAVCTPEELLQGLG
jgi:rfaE bifunctional protein kinase chain/domain